MSVIDALDMHGESFESFRRGPPTKPERAQRATLGGVVRQMLIDGRTQITIQALTGASAVFIKKQATELRQAGIPVAPGPGLPPPHRRVIPGQPSVSPDVMRDLKAAALARGTNVSGLVEAIVTTVVKDGLIEAVLEK